MKYQFIRDHASRCKVSSMCRALRVSGSGFYDWHDRKPSAILKAWAKTATDDGEEEVDAQAQMMMMMQGMMPGQRGRGPKQPKTPLDKEMAWLQRIVRSGGMA